MLSSWRQDVVVVEKRENQPRPCLSLGSSPSRRHFLGLAASMAAMPWLGSCGTDDGPRRADGSKVLPLENFFGNPHRISFKLSPCGAHIAFLMPWQGQMNVFVMPTGDLEGIPIRLTGATDRSIADYTWINDRQIAFAQDKDGDENFHLFVTNLDGGNPRDLTPFGPVTSRIVDPLEGHDDAVLISLNRRDPSAEDVYRLNTRTGELVMVAENPGAIVDWVTDHSGRLRLAKRIDGDRSTLLYRDRDDGPFRDLITVEFGDTLDPIMFTFDDRDLLVVSNIGRDKSALCRYDIASNRLAETLYEHPEVDVSRVVGSNWLRKLTEVEYYTDRSHRVFFDAGWQSVHDHLSQLFPGPEIYATSHCRDESRLIVMITGDTEPGVTVLYDRVTGQCRELARNAPMLKGAVLAEMKSISYQNRDGTILYGYLSLPPGKAPKNLPVVVLPHGGPWTRNYWGFSSEVQFLANRGYAVLQVNFRGSTSYGRRFLEAGYKQWGAGMQDDIADGARWLIERGIADPRRIAIYGSSFGGYSALMGAIRTPDLYACAAAINAPSNLFAILENLPAGWEAGRWMLYRQIGDPVTDAALLRAASPVFQTDHIRIPLLIAQGAHDPRVRKADSDRIVEAARARGIPVTYIVKENEGHGFVDEGNRLDLYRKIEIFLAQSLNSPAEM